MTSSRRMDSTSITDVPVKRSEPWARMSARSEEAEAPRKLEWRAAVRTLRSEEARRGLCVSREEGVVHCVVGRRFAPRTPSPREGEDEAGATQELARRAGHGQRLHQTACGEELNIQTEDGVLLRPHPRAE